MLIATIDIAGRPVLERDTSTENELIAQGLGYYRPSI